MIIVSQDKREIINFNNIASLYIKPSMQTNYDDSICYGDTYVIFYHNPETKYHMGEYATEERAIKVLQEICKTYSENKILELYTQLGNVAEANRQGFRLTPVYEMPEK